MQGGVLYVRPRKAHNLVKKNFFKGGFMHSTATVRVSIAGQSKKTAQVDGSNPTFSDVLEFILGGDCPHTMSLTPRTTACSNVAWMPYLHPYLTQQACPVSCPSWDTTLLLRCFDDNQATFSALQPCYGLLHCLIKFRVHRVHRPATSLDQDCMSLSQPITA